MPNRSSLLCALILVTLSFECASQNSPGAQTEVVVDQDGTVHIPALTVPLSEYMSAEAKTRFLAEIEQARKAVADQKKAPEPISRIRASVDERMQPKVERAKARYPVTIEEQRIAGVRTHIVTPKEGVSANNRQRVLINLHGGGFMVGAGLHGIAESIPVAGIGKFKVVTVDYRMAPEYKFPAASEDVAAVYKALLKQYGPKSIGIYGCSAGGTLSAMATAWFQKEKLPTPGAIGILGAAAFGNFISPGKEGSWNGDSAYLAPPLRGQKPSVPHETRHLPADAYLSEVDLTDPLVSPALSPTVLAQFPPTLVLTGTRAWDMSAAVQTHRELVKVGVAADLHLWDGMGHCFFLEEDLPESREAYGVVSRFFDQHLTNGIGAAHMAPIR